MANFQEWRLRHYAYVPKSRITSINIRKYSIFKVQKIYFQSFSVCTECVWKEWKPMLQRLIFDLMKTLKKSHVLHKSQSCSFRMDLFDLWVQWVQSEHQILELFLCKFCSFLFCPGPGRRIPSSKRLYRSRNPSPIQSRPLIRSDLLPQKRKRVPFSKGFWWYLSPMIMDSPSMPFRRSTYPQASTTLRIPAASLSMTDHLEDPVKQGFRNIVRYRNG